MAVYTKLNEKDIKDILSNYSIGKLEKFSGIKEGIENTNYLIETDKGRYILTIYEKRVNKHDLPFFSELMLGLSNKSFICPKPVSNKNNLYISDFENKKFMIVSCLEGKSKKNLSPSDCKIVGRESARLHEITKNFKIKINGEIDEPLLKEISIIERQLIEAKKTILNEQLRSPVKGKVFELIPASPGYAAVIGETLLKIVPDGEIEAKVFITNKDIENEKRYLISLNLSLIHI